MLKRREYRPAQLLRRFEKASIFLFALTSLGILLINSGLTKSTPAFSQANPTIYTQASAMPNQGWLPLRVYFSAYGSRSPDSTIVRYEWDLDGNGRFDYDATAEGGYASYLYSKSGEYTVSLRTTDARGQFNIDQVKIRVRHPASSSVDYWTVFDDSQVQRIQVDLTQTDWDRLWESPESKLMVKADATVFGEKLSEVGFRMRGQFSLRESGAKKPWKIDTDAYVAGQEFHNLRQLMLLNNIGDPSLLEEKLAYAMIEFAGLPASHVAFVELWIDLTDDSQPPIFWGVYSLVERVDNKYLANRFGAESKGGNLYKASHAQRGPMDLIYYGDRIEDYPTQNGQSAYGKMNNEDENDYSDVIDLCRVIDGTTYASQAEFTQALESALNVDAFLRYMAVNVILDNWDSYPYTGNNYYLFDNPATQRFEWIPWDLTWGENVETPLFQRSGPVLVQRAPLYDRVFQVDAYRSQYLAYVDLLLRYWFNTENITSLAQQYQRQIAPSITQSGGDKAFFGEQPMFPEEAFQDAWQNLIRFASEREAFLQQALKTAGQEQVQP